MGTPEDVAAEKYFTPPDVKEVSVKAKRACINIPREVKEALDKLRYPGQSRWGVIKDLIEEHKRR